MNYNEKLNAVFKEQAEFGGLDKTVNTIIPLVSVHVITYQHVKFIEQCLENILSQKTTFDIEIVIGEDGSTDGTREICIQYAERYPDKIRLFQRDRIKTVIKGPDRNIYLNGKLTTKSCRGKYIAICEGDDYWTDPSKLQKQIDFLEGNNEYVLCGHFVGIDNGQIRYPDNIIFKSFNQSEVCKNHIPTLSAVFRNKVFDFSDDIINIPYGDFALWILLGQHGKFAILPEIMANYRVHAGGLWSGAMEVLKLKQSIISRLSASKYIVGNKTATLSDIKKRARKGLKLSIKSFKIKDVMFFTKILLID